MQKVWLGIFLAMFIVPEILWGNLLGLVHIKPVYNNTQFFEDKPIYLFVIFIIEIIGVGGLIYLLKKFTPINKWANMIIAIILWLLLLVLVVALYEAYVITHISFP